MRCLGNLKWSEFNQAIKRKIKELEKNHARKAYVVWETTNPIGERFLYVRLGKKNDPGNLIATVAVYDINVIGCWNTIPF